MRKVVLTLIIAMLLCILPINEFAFHGDAQISSSASMNYPFQLDSFESFNATGESNVMSMDSRGGDLAGCATFSGEISNPNLGGTSLTSNGGVDVLLFGWSQTNGYWATSFGGAQDEFCAKVKWVDNSTIGVSGSYKQNMLIGSTNLQAVGWQDGFYLEFSPSNSTWISAFAIGTQSNEKIWSFSKLNNGSTVLLGASSGNFTPEYPAIGGPDCTINNGDCTFHALLDQSGNLIRMASISSTLNTIGRDIIEIGVTGKTLTVGYFSGSIYQSQVQNNPQISASSNDIFVLRSGADFTYEFLTTFGGSGLDFGITINQIPSGFVVTGMVDASASTRPSITHPTAMNYTLPNGSGGLDGVILEVTPNGLIQGGLTVGSTGTDYIADSQMSNDGKLHISGYIGAAMQHPQGNGSVGVNGVNSAFYGVVNYSSYLNSKLVDAYSSTGSSNSDARTNAVAILNSEDVWIGGRLTPSSVSNSFFGESASGYNNAAYILRVGSDVDGDLVAKRLDNCPEIYNLNQSDYDSDQDGDSCDDDDDDDGIPDSIDDLCQYSTNQEFRSTPSTDNDGDGCEDNSEDLDDDNDGFQDQQDTICPKGYVNWTAGQSEFDRDSDGCHDQFEDDDSDGDGYIDDQESCSSSNSVVFNISTWEDDDLDGCHNSEDEDLDNDGVLNLQDRCDNSQLGWISNSSDDYDSDGCRDSDEDNDDDGDSVDDVDDLCSAQDQSVLRNEYQGIWIDIDIDGCLDTFEDDDNDADGVPNALDSCPNGEIRWNNVLFDYDGDGCKDDTAEDLDDDNDGIEDEDDNCDLANSTNPRTDWISDSQSDYDSDGCKDEGVENNGIGEDTDDDSDGVSDSLDIRCPRSSLILIEPDYDLDGCFDVTEDFDDDNDGRTDEYDNCPTGEISWDSDDANIDRDSDGCHDSVEDSDDDGDGLDDVEGIDFCRSSSSEVFVSSPITDFDSDGCLDGSIEDNDDDNDGVSDDLDLCDVDGPLPGLELNWSSSLETDFDLDGCKDSGAVNQGLGEDRDDDNDQRRDDQDRCDPDGPYDVLMKSWDSNDPALDKDADGCQDLNEDEDQIQASIDQKRKENLIAGGVGIFVLIVVCLTIANAGRRLILKNSNVGTVNQGDATNLETNLDVPNYDKSEASNLD